MRLIHKITLTTLFVASTLLNESHAQLVTYTFGSTATPVVSANQVATNLTASVFSGNSGTPSTGGTSPLSSGAYFAASSWSGSSPGTNYFEFTITPDAGFVFSTTSISFDYRATTTGPTTLAIRSSADSYATQLGSFTTTADSNWYASGVVGTALSNLTVATTFRIYGFGASSGGGTLRVDNVALGGSVSVSPVPEPATFALFGGITSLGLAAFRRRHTSRLSSAR